MGLLLGLTRVADGIVLELRLQDAEDVGAGHAVFRAVRDDDVRAGVRRIHDGAVFVAVFPGVVAFVDAREDDPRSRRARDVRPGEYQGHFRFGIGEGVVGVTQIDIDLAVPGALQDVRAGLLDVQHRIGVSLLLAVHHGRRNGRASLRIRQSREDVVFVPFRRVVIAPFGLVVVLLRDERALIQLRIVDQVVRDVGRGIGIGLGAGIVFGRRVLDVVVDLGRIRVPGVVEFLERFAVQRRRAVFVQGQHVRAFIFLQQGLDAFRLFCPIVLLNDGSGRTPCEQACRQKKAQQDRHRLFYRYFLAFHMVIPLLQNKIPTLRGYPVKNA